MLEEIRLLQAMPDEAIDTFDVPEASADKAPIIIRLDTDIIARFKDNADISSQSTGRRANS